MQRNGGTWLWLAAIGAACATLAVSGCGDGAADPQGPAATLRVTRDFGRELLASNDSAALGKRTTMLQLLREHHEVGTTSSGGTIEAIDGRRRVDALYPRETIWAANVNGVETDVLANDYRLYDGDVVQLDLRHWYVTLDVRATVGAFPETFTRGVFGRRFPTTVRCERPASAACRHVKRLLHRAGVKTDGTRPPGKPPPPLTPRRAQVLVGTWRHWRDGEWPQRIDRGARYSGVFARFAPDARSMRLLDWNNHRVRSVGAGSGLVAAMRPTEEDLMWLVTGVDDAGVERAAQALDSPGLRDAFGAAVTADGVEKLPLVPSRQARAR